MKMFTIDDVPVTGREYLACIVLTVVSWIVLFLIGTWFGEALTGSELGGYAFAIFCAVVGRVITLSPKEERGRLRK